LVFCYHSEGALLVSRFGWVGVDLFFVLSGYLVSGLLFREFQQTGGLRIGRFLIRRGFKIYPSFYIFIALTVLFTAARGRVDPLAVARELLFVQNYFPGMWTHTWSLAVEEHFYLLLAAGMWWLARRPSPQPFSALPKIVGAICVGTLALRTILVYAAGAATQPMVYASHLRFDSLLTGVLIAYFQTSHPDALSRWMRHAGPWLMPVSVLLISPVAFMLREDAFMVAFGFSFVAWGFGLLLLSVLYPMKPAASPGRGARAMAALGRNSYAFYLWHGPVILTSDFWRPELASRGFDVNLGMNLVLTFAISTLLAVATTCWIEAPALRLRDRWFPGGASAPATAAPGLHELKPVAGL
jgi:peptidoglycan/LPS O-acetylase OafA/YrhL